MAVLNRVLSSLVLVLVLAGCPETNNVTQTLNVSPPAISLSVGESQRVQASSTDPLDTIQYSSNAPDIASISNTGRVTAHAEGNATITVTASNSGLSDTVRVAVVGEVAVIPGSLILQPGRTAVLEARSKDDTDTFSWTSMDESIATVSASGMVTAVSEGDVFIQAEGSSSGSKGSAAVTVLPVSDVPVDVTPLEVVLRPAQRTTLAAAVPDDEDTFVWTSSDRQIASVDANGVVTALSTGEASIIAIGTKTFGAGSSVVTVLPGPTAEIAVAPSELLLRPGRVATLVATSTQATDTFHWTSSDTNVATVDEAGAVTAVAAGMATIRATGMQSGASSTALVTVSAADQATVQVSPGRIVVRPTRSAFLSATSTNSGDSFGWTSSDDTIATVNGSGLVTGVAEGEAEVTATGSLSGSTGVATVVISGTPPASVTVNPVQITLQPGEGALLAAESTDPADTFTWFSTDTRFVTVDSSGNITANDEGQATVVARGVNSGVIGTSAVRIIAQAAADVSVSPANVVLRPGKTSALTATSTDPADTFEWSSSEPGIATVNANGVVTAVAAGEAEITATGANSGNSGTSTVTVAAVTPVAVSVSPAEVSLRPTQTATLDATSTDGNDTITWASSDPSVATVDDNGVVTAEAVGEAAIVATGSNSGGTDAANVIVAGRPPATITVTPDEFILRPDLVATLTANSTDPEDNFAWTSSDTAIATVGAAGTVTGVAEGQATITATGTASGDSGNAVVTVNAAIPDEITVVPAELSLRPTRTATVTAESTNADDALQWASADLAVATVDGDGRVTAVAGGQTVITVTGTASGISNTVSVTVSDAEAADISVSPAVVNLQVSETAAMTATSTDPEDAFTWSSADTSIATVNLSGLVTAVGEGETSIIARGTNSRSAGTAVVQVSNTDPAEVTITPVESTIRVGEIMELDAASSDPEDTFNWTTSSNFIAIVDQNGTIIGTEEGVAVIWASGSNSESVGNATITVSGFVPSAVTVTPTEASLRPTETVALAAASTDELDAISWSSANESVATVNSAGTVTAIAEGEAIITATGSNSEDSASAAITVAGRPPATITVDPPTVTLRPLQTAMYTAASTDALDSFSWSTADESIATVDIGGVVTALAEGETTVTATGTATGDSGSATVVVAGRPVAEITVTPQESAVRVGLTTTLAATSTDAEDDIAWSSANESVATVSANGTVTGTGVGEADIIATGTASGDSGSARVTVGTADVAIESSRLPLPVGDTEQFKAVSTDPNDTKYTWTSSNEDVAVVSGSGVVLGVNVGTTFVRAVGSKSNSAGLVEVSIVPRGTSFIIWDGEDGFVGENGSLNTTEAARGSGCAEGILGGSGSLAINLDGESSRSDISSYDEIWLFAKSELVGSVLSLRISNNPANSALVEVGTLTPDYQLFRIPIGSLQSGGNLLSSITRLNFHLESDTNGVFYIDEVRAVDLSPYDAAGIPVLGAVSGLDFGGVAVGESAESAVSITNAGTDTIRITGISLSGHNATEFHVANESFSLSPGASHSVDVMFSPATVVNKAVGDKVATLGIAHELTPLGGITSVAVRGRALSPAIATSASVLDFGTIPVGSSASKVLTVANEGNAELEVSFGELPDPSFLIAPDTLSVPPGESQGVTLTYMPAEPGSASGTLPVATNAANSEEVQLQLAGAAVASGEIAPLNVVVSNVTSSTVEIAWPNIDTADQIEVYVGPEPPSGGGIAELPLQTQLGTADGQTASMVVDSLAPAVDTFFHVKIKDADGSVIAQGNAHALTKGGPRAELDGVVREVYLAAPNIVCVVLTNEHAHSYSNENSFFDLGIEEVIGDTGAEFQAGPWSITRADGSAIDITNVYRKSSPIGQFYYDVGFGEPTWDNFLDIDHEIYLVLPEPVGSPEILTITGPTVAYEFLTQQFERLDKEASVNFTLPFSDRYLETPSLQVNQVGYSPRATQRWAYVSGWMGDGGPLPLNGFPSIAEVLVQPEDPLAARNSVVSGISLEDRVSADPDSGTDIKQIDLSGVPPAEETVYRVRIPGVGVSWPTQINETAVFKAFYTVARGLFHNRWGGDLRPDLTEWSRPPDHPTAFVSEETDPWHQFDEDTPQVGEFLLAGGHHDAGDFDIRIWHGLVGEILLNAYEANAENFRDGQLTIPESGNGIPDLLDEALWSLAAWEQLQEPDGGVRIGVESFRHPFGIYNAHNDELPYFTYSVNAIHTMRAAGLFAQAARLVRPYDPEKADELLARAEMAYDFALANGITEEGGGPVVYAAGELLRNTGDLDYRNTLVAAWDAKWPGHGRLPSIFARDIPWTGSYLLDDQPIVPDHLMGYMGSPEVLPDHLLGIEEWLDGHLISTGEKMEARHGHRNLRPESLPQKWGRGSAVGQYLRVMYPNLQFRDDLSAEDMQRIIDAMSLSADYVLGCNPMGRSWITGLGSRSPQDPLHLDSLAFMAEGMPPIPGIPVYGPTSSIPDRSAYAFGEKLAYPPYADHPPLRRYADVHFFIACNEFTVWETQGVQTRLFAALLGEPLLPPDSWLPGGEEHRNTLAPREAADTE